MQREYLILMQGEKSCGAVKIEMSGDGLLADINVDESCSLGANRVFRAYLVMPEKGEKRYLGVLEDHSGGFVLKDTAAPLGIVLTVKDTITGNEEFCCLCAEEGKLGEVQRCFEGGNSEKNEVVTPVEKEEEKPPVQFEKEYLKTASEKLMGMFPDFSFEKVNGYFIRNNSRIVEYIMSGNEVCRRVTAHGYYYFAVKNSGDCFEFIIAVPSQNGENAPFENCEKYSFEVNSDGVSEEKFFCVAAGKDMDGEYFCKRKNN